MSLNIATIGNPNSGKTTLFNALTGSHQKVGNWSGVTVEKKIGQFQLEGKKSVNVIDLPGIYNLDNDESGSSLDERIAFEYVMQNEPDIVMNIIDASCLERSLYLTLQLLELGLPVLVVLNKMDLAVKQNLVINEKLLSQQLNCPVVSLSALEQGSVKQLTRTLNNIDFTHLKHGLALDYGSELQPVIDKVSHSLMLESGLSHKALAIKCIEGDQSVLKALSESKQEQVKQLKNSLSIDLDLQIADVRYTYIYQLTQQAVRTKGHLSQNLTEKIDAITLNRFTGIPVFLLVMYLMFMFSINIGSAFIDFFDIAAGAIFVDETAYWLSAINTPDWIINVLAYGVGNGIQTVMTFIPVIACLYLFLAILVLPCLKIGHTE